MADKPSNRLSWSSIRAMLFKRGRRKLQTGSAGPEVATKRPASISRPLSAQDRDPRRAEKPLPPITIHEDPLELSPMHFTDADVHCFHDPSTATTSFLVADKYNRHALIIDPVLEASGTGIETSAADQILAAVDQHKLTVDRILETNSPMDYPSAVWYLRNQLQQVQGTVPRTCHGKSFAGIQRMFERKYAGSLKYDLSKDIDPDFEDEAVFEIGSVRVKVMKLPAQAPEHTALLIDSNIFIGDPMLVGKPDDIRTRCEGEVLNRVWSSMSRLLRLPPDVKVYCSQRCRTSEQGNDFSTVEEVRSMYESDGA